MNKNKNIKYIRLMAMLLAIALILPMGIINAKAEGVQPRASYYLDSYNAYIYPAGSGKIQVWFTVSGMDYMDTIGALTIRIYESRDNSNWTWVKSFTHESTAGMLDYDDHYHSGHVDYQGVVGRYYKAYVCIWAGKDGGGDTRYFYTSVKKAV